MALAFGKLIHAMKSIAGGGMDPDALPELFSSMGVEASFTPVPQGDTRAEFEALWLAATALGAQVHQIEFRKKSGEKCSGLLVLSNESGTTFPQT
jgi:hypothetical protein